MYSATGTLKHYAHGKDQDFHRWQRDDRRPIELVKFVEKRHSE